MSEPENTPADESAVLEQPAEAEQHPALAELGDDANLTAEEAAELLEQIEAEPIGADAEPRDKAKDEPQDEPDGPPPLASDEQRRGAAEWWARNRAPALAQYHARWQGMDWAKLAAERPDVYPQLVEQFRRETALAQQADQLLDGELKAERKRAEDAHEQAVEREHATLAKHYPAEFGDKKRADKSYQELATWLLQQGVPAERIAATHEAAIVSIAWRAMQHDKQQAAEGRQQVRVAPSTETARAKLRRIQRTGESINVEEAVQMLDALQ